MEDVKGPKTKRASGPHKNIPFLATKLKMLKELDRKEGNEFLTERLSRAVAQDKFGEHYKKDELKRSQVLVKKAMASWETGKDITRDYAAFLLTAIQEWIQETYAGKITFEKEDLVDGNLTRFSSKILGFGDSQITPTLEPVAAGDPRYRFDLDAFKRSFRDYHGFFVAWTPWIDSDGNPTIYQFLVRIGNQKVTRDKVTIDPDTSIDFDQRRVNAYMTTARHWDIWKEKNQSCADYDLYRQYGWWGGEMIPSINDVVWYRFWNDKDGTAGKYTIILSEDRKERVNVENFGIVGLCLAQPRSTDTRKGRAKPTCTKVYMKYIGTELPLSRDEGGIIYWLNQMRHLPKNEVENDILKNIDNKITEFNLFQP